MEKSDYTVLAKRAAKQSAVYRRNRKRTRIAEDIVEKSATAVAQLEKAECIEK